MVSALSDFVLVGGPPSSGSTLLSVMLDSHPDMMCGPETNLFAHPGIWAPGDDVDRYLELPDEPVSVASGTTWARPATAAFDYYEVTSDGLKEAAQRGGVEALADHLFAPRLAAEAKRVRCEKSPPNIYAMHQALAAWPELKAIVMVRNAPDVLRSLSRRKVRPEVAVHRWLADCNLSYSALRRFGPKRVRIVRYEDLLGAPEDIAKGLCNFLGVPADGAAAMLDRSSSKRFGTDHSISGTSGAAAVWQHRPGDPIATPKDRDTRPLTSDEIDLLNSARLDRKAMRHLGMTSAPLSARQVAQALGYDAPWHRVQFKARHHKWKNTINRLFAFYGEISTKRLWLYLGRF